MLRPCEQGFWTSSRISFLILDEESLERERMKKSEASEKKQVQVVFVTCLFVG